MIGLRGMIDLVENQKKHLAWNDELEREIFTPAEIAASNCSVAISREIFKAQEQGIDRKKLAKLSGIDTNRLARVAGDRWVSAQINDVLAVLGALGKTLKVVPIEEGLKS